MQLGHFVYERPWIPEEIRKRIRDARAAEALAQATTPWNPPAAKAPTGQAEEEQTTVRFEPATGTVEAERTGFHLEAEHRPHPQVSGPPGVGRVG